MPSCSSPTWGNRRLSKSGVVSHIRCKGHRPSRIRRPEVFHSIVSGAGAVFSRSPEKPGKARRFNEIGSRPDRRDHRLELFWGPSHVGSTGPDAFRGLTSPGRRAWLGGPDGRRVEGLAPPGLRRDRDDPRGGRDGSGCRPGVWRARGEASPTRRGAVTGVVHLSHLGKTQQRYVKFRDVSRKPLRQSHLACSSPSRMDIRPGRPQRRAWKGHQAGWHTIEVIKV
jgi:hypothetical protein